MFKATPEGRANTPKMSKLGSFKLMRMILDVTGVDLLTAFKNSVLRAPSDPKDYYSLHLSIRFVLYVPT